MATVGYGDIHPQSNVGKILALILIVGGVGTFLGVVASITEYFSSAGKNHFDGKSSTW
jgi:voltage-gated potassium channel